MRYSRMLLPTVKEVPNDAEIPSHQLMMRAGLIRKVASGTYAYLPAGWRVLNKIMTIIRDEMDKAGAQEVLLPAVQPMELWQKTGRDVDYGPTMAKFKDRHGRMNVLAPTAEEVMTSVVGGEINSYKQLPMNIYQICFKFRDEFRPRFGVLRSREFIMKDAYSFHADEESLQETYMEMYEAYKRVFERAGIPYVIVEAETGEMGGSSSHQFTVPCETGEDVIVYTEDGKYAASIEKAAVDPAERAKVDESLPAVEEVATPNVKTIEELCEFFKCGAEHFIKTLIYRTPTSDDSLKQISEDSIKHPHKQGWGSSEATWINHYAVIVRGDHEVNPEKLTQLLGGIHLELAEETIVKKLTGAEVGFAGPVGFKGNIIIDHSVAAMKAGIAGANKTDAHLKNVVPGRDFALEGDKVQVADVRNAVEGDTYEGKKLLFKRGIEVGQVFKLGTKYSGKLGVNFLDESGKLQPVLMGCYGIGVNRVMASAIETGNDENGIIWPISIAPFEVLITPVGNDDEIMAAAQDLHDKLEAAGVDVLLDDRDARGGVKFKDADLLGVPVRITVGKKSLAEGKVEVKLRSGGDMDMIDIIVAPTEVVRMVGEMKKNLAAD